MKACQEAIQLKLKPYTEKLTIEKNRIISCLCYAKNKVPADSGTQTMVFDENP